MVFHTIRNSIAGEVDDTRTHLLLIIINSMNKYSRHILSISSPRQGVLSTCEKNSNARIPGHVMCRTITLPFPACVATASCISLSFRRDQSDQPAIALGYPGKNCVQKLANTAEKAFADCALLWTRTDCCLSRITRKPLDYRSGQP
jgi:hypothetical protein